MAKRPNVEYIRFYTDGSAALKPVPVQSKQPKVKAAPKKAKRIKIFVDPVAMLSIVVAVCMLVAVLTGFVRLKQAKEQVAVMEEYVEDLQAEHTMLTHRYESGYDLDKIRQTALALDMIPAEHAPHISIEMPQQVQEVPQLTMWERISTFLTGLFA